MVKVGRGDTLAGIITKVGADPDQAKAIVEAFAPVFPLQNLKPGQQVRFNLVPAPGDTDQMEPVKVSVYAGDKHLASVARNNRGDFVVTDQKGGLTAEGAEQQQRATLYASFYHAAHSQRIPADTILKLLRVHSYDVDFKQKVKPGDTFDVFFDVPDDGKGRERDGRAALHLDDRRRPHPQLLSLPHP